MSMAFTSSKTEGKETLKRGKPTLLFNFFLIMGALVSFALYESFRFLKESDTSNIVGGGETLIMVLGSLLISSLLIYLGHRYFEVKLNRPIAIIMATLFIGNLIALLSFPNPWVDPNGATYILDADSRFAYIISYGAEMLYMYIFLGMAPQVQKGENGFAFVLEFIIIAAYVAVIYSYINEWNQYSDYFTHLFGGEAMPPRGNIKSYTYICNTYGAFLFYAGSAELAFHHRDRKWWRLLAAVFFFFNAVIVQSKTTTISFGLMIILYLILDGFILLKEDKRLHGLILLSIVFGFIIVSLILYLTPSPVHDFVYNFYRHYVLDDSSTFMSRVRIWEKIFAVLGDNPLLMIFGIGNTNFFLAMRFVHGYNYPTAAAHSGFVEVLARGGILATLAYISFLLYFAYIFIKLIKRKHTRHYWFYIIFLLTFLSRSIAESEAIITPDWNGILACVFGVFPVFAAYFGKKGEDEVKVRFAIKDYLNFALQMAPGALITLGFVLLSLSISLSSPILGLLGLIIQLISFLYLGNKTGNRYGPLIVILLAFSLDLYLGVIQLVVPAFFDVDSIYFATVSLVNFFGVGIISSIYLAELLPLEEAIKSRDRIELRYQSNRW